MKQKVDLGERSYEIFISSGALALALEKRSEILSSGRSVAWVADSKVLELHKNSLSKIFENSKNQNEKKLERVFPIDGGESSKSFCVFEKLCESFAESGMDRHSVIFALGGGVIGDLAGFAAASYMRGIDFYQVPTTLLAMVDSSVGGKTGINIRAGKNLVGAFYQPKGVFIDTDFLKTLNGREFAAGMGEVIKYALLGNAEFFQELLELSEKLSAKNEKLSAAISLCCKMKAEIVAGDERESLSENSGRALLNFGHTFAHAIEKCAGYGKYLHGEAVAIGMCMASSLSEKMGLISSQDFEKIKNLINSCELPTKCSSKIPANIFKDAMLHDKKNSGKQIRFVLLKSIGKAFVSSDVPQEMLDSVIEEFCS